MTGTSASGGLPLRQRAGVAVVVALVLAAPVSPEQPAEHRPVVHSSAETAFIQDNAAAMATMMTGMSARPSGDVDKDFVGMMVPHHQGAIDMAVAELRYGGNEQLKRIAQEIIVDQQQEIAAMRLAVGQPLPRAMPAPTVARPDGGGIVP